MLIVCPHCATSYRLDRESLGESGRSVRCVNCQNVWFEDLRQPAWQADEAMADASQVVEDSAEPATFGWDAADEPQDGALDDGIADQPGRSGEIDPDLPAFDAPPIVPESSAPIDGERDLQNRGTAQDVESIAARRRKRRRSQLRSSTSLSLPAMIGALILLLGCLVAARYQVVRHLPQTASLYALIGLPVNLRGLAFDNIRTAREIQDGVTMLIVEGDVIPTTGRLAEVPRLRFAVLDGAGKEIYAWTARPSRTLLQPGETLGFRSRLASPPADGSGVAVRFVNRRDAQAGLM